MTMKRTLCLALGLVITTAIAIALSAVDHTAYQTIGRLAVQQQGRRKPFDTLAREAIKQIHGAPSVKLTGARGSILATWPEVAVILDWSVRPQYWDNQKIILVPYRPLRQALLNGVARDITESSADQKWLSPKDIEDAVVNVDGKPVSFPEWFAAILAKDRAIRTAQSSGRIRGTPPIAPLSLLETKAMEAGERLIRYKALRDKNGRMLVGLEIEATPHPANAAYLAFTRDALLTSPRFVLETFPVENLDQASRDALQAAASHQGLDEFQVNALEVFASYIDEVKKKERFLPGTNKEVDARYLDWLEQKAAWVPIRFLLQLDLKELERAGYPIALVDAFRTAYRELETSERTHPGHASREKAASLVSAARALGTSVSRSYPVESALALETLYNRTAPFSWAPWSYGIALVLFLVSLGLTDNRGDGPRGKLGRSLYEAGIVALVTGIAVECYGFALRVMISGWAPVTNMYETVIWVALVTSILGLVLEWVHRKTFAALAASGISLLTTVLAATVSEQLLDPRIKSLTPVLRSNYWLTIHVLTIVSSYAAFALAMGLGMVAVVFYLTATYRRPARYGALAIPLIPGLILLVAGALLAGLAHSLAGPGWLSSDAAYYLAWGAAAVGGVLTIMSTFAMIGEAANRAPTRTLKAGLAGLGVGCVGLIAAWAGLGSELLFDGASSRESRGHRRSGRAVRNARRAGGRRSGRGRRRRGRVGDCPGERAGLVAVHAHSGSGVGTLTKPTIAQIRAMSVANRPRIDGRTLAMQATAVRIKPIAHFLDRSIQVGVLLVAAGTILGGIWADNSWGRFWGWDPKEVWALITLLVYLVPLHGRFAGWVTTFGLVVSSVVCFGSVVMAWYGVNFVLGVGLHSYGFSEGGGQGVVLAAVLAVLAVVFAAAWRRRIAQNGPAMD